MKIGRIATFTFALAIAALAVGLSGCERMAPMIPDDTTTMPGGFPIGVVVALTGDSTIYGIPMKNGFELASEEINANSDMNIMLIIEDDQSSVPGAESAVQSRSRRASSGWKCYLNAVQSGVFRLPKRLESWGSVRFPPLPV